MKVAIESSPGVIWRQRPGPETSAIVRFDALAAFGRGQHPVSCPAGDLVRALNPSLLRMFKMWLFACRSPITMTVMPSRATVVPPTC